MDLCKQSQDNPEANHLLINYIRNDIMSHTVSA